MTTDRDEIERLRAALLKYGNHLPGCAWQRPRLGCQCGFSEAVHTDSKGRALEWPTEEAS